MAPLPSNIHTVVLSLERLPHRKQPIVCLLAFIIMFVFGLLLGGIAKMVRISYLLILRQQQRYQQEVQLQAISQKFNVYTSSGK